MKHQQRTQSSILEALVGTKVQVVVKNSEGKDGRSYSNVDHIVRDKQQED